MDTCSFRASVIEEVGVRGGAALVAIDVLLEDAEVARELALGAVPSTGGQSLGKLSLQSFHGSGSHGSLPFTCS